MNSRINFLSFLYILTGPILLFVGTALLMPNVDSDDVDLNKHYFAVRSSYANVLILLFLWAIFASPILRGAIAPTAVIFAAFLVNAIVMRITADRTVHGVTAIVNWLLFTATIGIYFLQLGGPAAH